MFEARGDHAPSSRSGSPDGIYPGIPSTHDSFAVSPSSNPPASDPSSSNIPPPDSAIVIGLLGRLDAVDATFDDILDGLTVCDPAATLSLAARLARLGARLEGVTIRTHVHLARLRPPGLGDETGDPYSAFAADELAAELAQSPRTMSSRLATAWEIAEQLPAALADLTAGLLDHTRLAALHQLTACLTAEQRATVEAAMLAGGRLASPPRWRRKIHRLVARLDPDAAAKRRRRARADRMIGIQALDDGMATLTAVLTAEDARAIYDRINQIARTDARTDGDTRSIDARRADVLAALLLGNRREHVTVELQVIASVGTLAGLDDNPAELVGFGPIPGEAGRALAADARWRRVLTDPVTGTVLDLGRRRVPTPELARLIRHQQSRCVFPGCGMPAAQTDIDHTVAHTEGGRTALDNLGLLCRHHHRAKHSGDWHLDQPRPGVFHWTSPVGRKYIIDTHNNDEEALLPNEDHRDLASPIPDSIRARSDRQPVPHQRVQLDDPCRF
ncbi:HNH endonuclease signature motif containing protein [Pseudofrankia inefficax]|uniref:HNH endonuclease n=1 Tax=Pseudofrankia inefficax (strain DSM 45817 / CECT 9037 / DDB 130130 / EuI1c) TaxID=298654 RepID=E3JBF0_PSEI1|nr:HNH endonuclease signature motif containing protein [Pseudofrankia inefficax]ADP79822.1 HNH endonuclease [Pseudofrankia inefficax]